MTLMKQHQYLRLNLPLILKSIIAISRLCFTHYFILSIIFTILTNNNNSNINLINIVYNDGLFNSKRKLASSSSSKLIPSFRKWIWERINVWSRAKWVKSSTWGSKWISLRWLLLKLFRAKHITS